MKKLEKIPAANNENPPLVSIIVPACNEELTLEPALQSLLQQDYPNYEIIVIDDRSTDNTFALLQKLRLEFPEIQLMRITRLPEGWLGKNHALYQGAKLAAGKILLFTDADVVMEPSTLSRAVSYLTHEKLDHLSLVFRNATRGGLLNAMVVDALGGLFFLLRPWKVRNPASRAFIGIGAFNLITNRAYWNVGGHAAFAMHPIDDIMLGKKVKQQKMVQDCLLGGYFVQVHWYADVAGMIQGLMKNIFALYSYRLSYVAAGLCGIILGTIVPVWGMVLGVGAVSVFCGLSVLARSILFVLNARLMLIPVSSVLWSLFTPWLILYIVLKAVLGTIKNNGIDWRGTHYSLQELKKQEPLFTLSDLIR